MIHHGHDEVAVVIADVIETVHMVIDTDHRSRRTPQSLDDGSDDVRIRRIAAVIDEAVKGFVIDQLVERVFALVVLFVQT